MPQTPYAVTSRFLLTIGIHELGDFTSCDGLGVTTEVEERKEGGLDGRVWQLPTRLRYSNITLSRPLTKQTTLIWLWLQAQTIRPVRLPGQLVALGPDRRPLVRWILDGVVPVSWHGPSFSADQSDVARETLEIAHNGFLEVTV